MKRTILMVAILLFMLACNLGQSPLETFPTPTPPNTHALLITPTAMLELANIVAGACQGEPIPGAAEYRPDHAPHPVYFLSTSNDRHEWNEQMPQEWRAKTLEDIELVGCIEETETVIETCSYVPVGQADRYQFGVKIRLVIARTGEELLSYNKVGIPPEPCPTSLTTDLLNSTKQRIDGGRVEWVSVRSQFEFYVAASAPPLVVKLPEMGYFPAFSPDALLLASDNLKVVTIWNTTTGQTIYNLEQHEANIASMVFSPDGKILATRDKHGTIILWDVTTGQLLRVLTSIGSGADQIAFSPDGKSLASPSINLITLWDVSTGEPIGRYESFANNLAFSTDGKRLAAANLSGVYLWDLAAGQQEAKQIEQWDAVPVNVFKFPILFSLDGKILIYAVCNQNDKQGFGCIDGEIHLWDIERDQLLASFNGPTAAVTEMTISPDGKFLAASFCSHQTSDFDCENSQVNLWNLITQTFLYSFDVAGEIRDLIFSKDGKNVITASDDGTIIFWNVK